MAALGRAVAIARALAADVLEFVLPQRCAGCGVPASAERLLCDACRARIPRLTSTLCARCLVDEHEPVGCGRHRGFRVSAAWVYDERAAAIVQALKYGERPGLASALGPALAAALPADLPRSDLVLDVPLHAARERERGYNQAARLADALALATRTPRLERAVERVRATPAQARLGARERRENLAGAFRVRRPGALEGRRVLLVDDVITTGATLEGCLTALRSAGAEAHGVALAWAQ